MNLIKSQDYFSPFDVKKRCHIIGCGSVGSTIAVLLARLGITKISLYDFDTVASHNLANQMFVESDIKKPKVEAVKNLICSINSAAEPDIEIHSEGWDSKKKLNGYVFLCVDNIDLRREIAKTNVGNATIIAMFDFRTRLEDAQHYAADWKDPKSVENFIKTMDFTHEEAKKETPVTACNVEMGVAPTVWCICCLGVTNFMNFIKGNTIKKMVLFNPFEYDIDAY